MGASSNAHVGDGSEPRPVWLRIVDRASVAAFAVAWGLVGWRIAAAIDPGQLALLAIFGLPAALLAADLASGLVHWFADRYFDPTTPVLGPMLIEPFREHHRDPEAMTRHDFFEVSGNNGLVTLPLAAVLLAVGIEARDPAWLRLASVTTVLFASAIFVTNQLHAWAHAAHAPRLVRGLQRAGLVLSPAAHARHHAHAHDSAYCVATGWLNPVLDRMKLFTRLESWLARAGLELAVADAQEDPRR